METQVKIRTLEDRLVEGHHLKETRKERKVGRKVEVNSIRSQPQGLTDQRKNQMKYKLNYINSTAVL